MARMIDADELLKWAASNPLIDYKAFDELEAYIKRDVLAHHSEDKLDMVKQPDKLAEMIEVYCKQLDDMAAGKKVNHDVGLMDIVRQIHKRLKALEGK